MTEVTPSPDIFLGKRRAAMEDDYEEEMSEGFNPNRRKYVKPNRSFHSIEDRENVNLMEDDSNSCRNSSSAGAVKRMRGQNSSENLHLQAVENVKSVSEQLQRYHESMISSLKMEHQMALNRKDQEIQHLNNEKQRLNERCEAMIREHNVCLEENRILKKAVAIQDGRLREQTATHQELQHYAAQAVDHIQQLEKVNQEMKAQLLRSKTSGSGYGSSNNNSWSGGGGGFPPPPPDVY